jgi:hypothetical protein
MNNEHQLTNVEKVTRFMEGDGMNQAFVLQALDYYAQQIKAQEAKIKAQKNLFFNSNDWVRCAYDWELAAK